MLIDRTFNLMKAPTRFFKKVRSLFKMPPIKALDPNYNLYWRNKGMGIKLSEFRRRRIEATARIIEKGSTVLDVGCGDCETLKFLRNKHITSEEVGLDISIDAVNYGKQMGFDIRCVDMESEGWAESLKPVDYVIATEILEHVSCPEVIIRNVLPLTRKGLVVSIPNTGYFWHRIRLLVGSFPVQWKVFPGEHLRFWTIRDFRHWCRAMSLEIMDFIPYEGTPLLKSVWPNMFADGCLYFLKEKNNT